jgi:Ca-activated chloride channel homolog
VELADPFALLLLVLIAPLVGLLHRRRRRGITLSHTTALVGGRASARLRLARLAPYLRVLALVAFVIGIAGPRRADANSTVHAPGIDIALALDLSGSMETSWAPGKTRLQGARDVIESFIGQRTNDRIGLAVFEQEALSLAPPTLDHDALIAVVKTADSGLLPDGTGIGVGLAEAVNMLRNSTSASRVVILLTDGEQNAQSISPEDAAQLASALAIRVYTVGIVNAGSEGEVDRKRLATIAEKTGGKYFEASDPTALTNVYDTIGRLETSQLEQDHFERFQEFGPLMAAIGAGIIVAELLLRATWLRRVPA